MDIVVNNFSFTETEEKILINIKEWTKKFFRNFDVAEQILNQPLNTKNEK